MAASPSARQLTHDLANALGGARLRVALLRAETSGAAVDRHNLDALEHLLDQACAIEEVLHASIRRLFPKTDSGAADPPATKAKPARAPRPR